MEIAVIILVALVVVFVGSFAAYNFGVKRGRPEKAEEFTEEEVKIILQERGAEKIEKAEMEALQAVTQAALTIYDMCKAIDKGIIISDIKLLKKSGGKSGIWKRK